jgi:hypothetical protein
MRAVSAVLLLALVSLTTCRTIQWTNAGGNPLWSFAKNWDLGVPTLSDDVIIDVPNIVGSVQIGGDSAFANSLVVGGTSSFLQSLIIQGQLTVGAGGVQIQPNGQVTLNAAPSSPLTVAGEFQGTSNFFFISGALAGAGTFTLVNLNFTGPALKVINATTTIGTLQIVPGDGAQGSVNIASQQLVVTGTLYASATTNIYSNPGASLQVKGTFQYSGSAGVNSVSIQGDATIATLSINGGTVTLSDNVNVASTTVSSGAILTLIGGTTSSRNIHDITGDGTLAVQGGTNNFDTLSGISSVLLQGGVLNTNGNTVTIGNLQQSGGTLTGSATITIGTFTLTNSNIQGPTISTSNLNVKGLAALDDTTLTVTSLGVISASSQFTLANGAQFVVSSKGKVSQSAPFKLLPSGSDQPPLFTNNGIWTSTSDFLLVVNTRGSGSFQLGQGASISISGIAFNIDSLTLTGATFTVTGSVVTINTVNGQGGVITAEGRQFLVTTLNVDTYTHTNGDTEIGSGTIGTLDVQTGTVNVTGSGATIGVLLFEGGQISGNNPSATVVLTIGNATLTGNQPKILNNLTAKFQELNLKCGPQQCQLFTQDANIIIGGPSENK